jgi:hypothetical protein
MAKNSNCGAGKSFDECFKERASTEPVKMENSTLGSQSVPFKKFVNSASASEPFKITKVADASVFDLVQTDKKDISSRPVMHKNNNCGAGHTPEECFKESTATEPVIMEDSKLGSQSVPFKKFVNSASASEPFKITKVANASVFDLAQTDKKDISSRPVMHKNNNCGAGHTPEECFKETTTTDPVKMEDSISGSQSVPFKKFVNSASASEPFKITKVADASVFNLVQTVKKDISSRDVNEKHKAVHANKNLEQTQHHAMKKAVADSKK